MDLEIENIEALAKEANLISTWCTPTYLYDLLLIGDGTGNYPSQPCGFCCIAFNHWNKCAILHRGGFNHGGKNFSELIPYVHALQYDFCVQPKAKKSFLFEKCYVDIISGNKLIVDQGNKKKVRDSNFLLWSAIDDCENLGYIIHWNYVSKDNVYFNALCNGLAMKEKQKMS